MLEQNHLSADDVLGGERRDLIENGEEGEDVLAEVVLAVSVSGPRVQPPRLDHKFEERIENAEAFLNRVLLVRRLHSLRALAHAAEQTTATKTTSIRKQ